MYQEQIAAETANHLRSHLPTYLSELQSQFTGSDKLKLSVPDITTVSLVGGVIQTEIESMPVVAVDCLNKSVIPSNESLYYSQYDGGIAGMVSASSETTCDKIAKRYASALEKFVKDHLLFHENFQTNTKDFSIRELVWQSTRFSGAIELPTETENDNPVWVEGFVLDILWVTSEDGPRQH